MSRVSAEEKRARMLQLFYETKSYYQLKDLEKLAPKEKGIRANIVKEILESLVDDGSVDSAKIGGSIYYWAFPSKGLQTRGRKLAEITLQFEHSAKELEKVQESIEVAKINDADDAERLTTLEAVSDLKNERNEMEKKLKVFKDNDPKLLKKLKSDTEEIKAATNKWIDNIFSLKSWCQKKFFIESSVLNKQFEIPEDLDYLP